MSKILIFNIIIGIFFGVFLSLVLYVLSMGTDLVGQCYAGFFLTLPLMLIIWIETKKINDRSILFLGGPLLSISVSLSFYFIASLASSSLYKETPYILLAFVLFYSLVQFVMYSDKQIKNRN